VRATIASAKKTGRNIALIVGTGLPKLKRPLPPAPPSSAAAGELLELLPVVGRGRRAQLGLVDLPARLVRAADRAQREQGPARCQSDQDDDGCGDGKGLLHFGFLLDRDGSPDG